MIAALTIILLLAYTGLFYVYYAAWRRLPDYIPVSLPTVSVSVVIAARNEEKTLPHLVSDLAQQTYPSHLMEVIIVNDFSTDGTAGLAAILPPRFSMILPSSSPVHSSKKKAIAAGVARAGGRLIVVTDADCRVGENWVATLAAFYQEKGARFIAAPVKYTYQPSLLQVLQVLDFVTLQGITAASVAANMHTMCNGANLAYTKEAFEAVSGFAGIDNVASGDDMLLMHKIWKQEPSKVFYLKSKNAIVTTAAVPAWRDFLQQRRRWASKTLVYDDYRIIAVLGLVLAVNLLPFVLLVAGFFQVYYFLYLLLFFVVKTAIEWPFVASVAQFYGQQKLLRYFALLQPLHVVYTVVVGIWSQLGRYEWKGRTAG